MWKIRLSSHSPRPRGAATLLRAAGDVAKDSREIRKIARNAQGHRDIRKTSAAAADIMKATRRREYETREFQSSARDPRRPRASREQRSGAATAAKQKGWE